MEEPAEGRFEIREQEGPPRGDLYELEQVTYYQVIDKHSNEIVATFEGLLEASLSPDDAQWTDFRLSGVCSVTITPDGGSVLVKYADGREEIVPLPC